MIGSNGRLFTQDFNVIVNRRPYTQAETVDRNEGHETALLVPLVRVAGGVCISVSPTSSSSARLLYAHDAYGLV